jgi:hypothetical protein
MIIFRFYRPQSNVLHHYRCMLSRAEVKREVWIWQVEAVPGTKIKLVEKDGLEQYWNIDFVIAEVV